MVLEKTGAPELVLCTKRGKQVYPLYEQIANVIYSVLLSLSNAIQFNNRKCGSYRSNKARLFLTCDSPFKVFRIEKLLSVVLLLYMSS